MVWIMLAVALTVNISHYDTASPAEPKTAGSLEGGFPLAIVDSLGRRVRLESKPVRIISLASSNTEILFALGLKDRVVGIITYCNYPPEATQKDKVSGFSTPKP